MKIWEEKYMKQELLPEEFHGVCVCGGTDSPSLSCSAVDCSKAALSLGRHEVLYYGLAVDDPLGNGLWSSLILLPWWDTLTKERWGGMRLVSWHFQIIAHYWGVLDRHSGRIVKGKLPRNPSSRLTQVHVYLHVLFNPELPVQGWCHPEWLGPPASIHNQDNPLQICPWIKLTIAILQVRFFSHMTLDNAKLRIKTNRDSS